MLIVDSQVHIWGANTPERPWPTSKNGLKPVPVHNNGVPFTRDFVLREMQAAGVDRVIIVPPSWEGDRNDLALEASQRHPDRFAVMGRLDIDAADARRQIAGWLKQPGMLGLRFAFHTPLLEKPLLDGRTDWVWAAAEEAGIPIMVLATHAQMPLIERVARGHPRLKLVMDHLGLAGDRKDAEAFRDLDQLLALGRRPNVAVKASILPFFVTDPYPYRSLHPYLRRVYEAYGPQRLFWGTDLSRLPCTYREGVTMFTEEIPWLSDEDREWIMGRGVCEWLGWNMPR
ncbi:MAG TPA: amidohydrolase family protein [Burkholderiales bacterium]|nr:amidohydrolase family protein [Burkholderiales bacterium]